MELMAGRVLTPEFACVTEKGFIRKRSIQKTIYLKKDIGGYNDHKFITPLKLAISDSLESNYHFAACLEV